MKNLGFSKFTQELKRLNKGVDLIARDFDETPIRHIIGYVPIDKINIPNGYYYNEKNGITNKYNTDDGLYESYMYYQIKES